MSEHIKACIYCKQTNPDKFKGVEHVIPQAFGAFGSATPTLDCVCDDCNSHFGRRLDAYLARETMEGITRYKRDILSSEARPQTKLQITLAEGPETGQFAGTKVAIDGTNAGLMKPKAQFYILNQKTGKQENYFKHQLDGLKLPEDVYGKPGTAEARGTWKCGIFATSKEELEDIAATLRANGIDYRVGEPFLIPEPSAPDSQGKHTVPVYIEGEINEQHRQAHAKILFNFIAKYFGYEEVIKPEWDSLRRFARYGEGTIKFLYNAEEGRVPPEVTDQLRLLTEQSVIVQIYNSGERLIGQLRFFGEYSYRYVLHEDASIPFVQGFGYIFTAGKEPAFLRLAKI